MCALLLFKTLLRTRSDRYNFRSGMIKQEITIEQLLSSAKAQAGPGDMEVDDVCSTLTDLQRATVTELVEVHQFSKGTILRNEGDPATTCFTVEVGCVRQYYVVDGEERTTFFYTEGQTIFRPNSVSNKVRATPCLACLEDTVLTSISLENEAKLFQQCPEFVAISRRSLEQELGNYQELLANYITSSPEQRYEDLLNERPELLKRVPQYHLASYLGVRPESLSRIRRRVVKR